MIALNPNVDHATAVIIMQLLESEVITIPEARELIIETRWITCPNCNREITV